MRYDKCIVCADGAKQSLSYSMYIAIVCPRNFGALLKRLKC